MTAHDHSVWDADEPPVMDESFWDERYRSAPQVWSGRPNAQLVAEAEGLVAGSALDIGAGEGGDAIWLAERGWSVTAVELSSVAVERGRRQAEQVGVDGRITWVQADVTAWVPPVATFDLVTTQFLHLPPGHREPVFARCAAAVAPGGTLLIVGHHPSDIHAGVGRPSWPELMFTAEEIAATLDDAWDVVASDARRRETPRADGTTAQIHDAVLVARRLPEPPRG